MKKLYRSKKDRKIAGIFGGMAELYGSDPSLLRIIYALLALFTGVVPLVILYVIAWVIVPEEAGTPVPSSQA